MARSFDPDDTEYSPLQSTPRIDAFWHLFREIRDSDEGSVQEIIQKAIQER